MKILVVDDDIQFIISVKKLLDGDYDITTTTDPKEGIVLASNNYYDLIIVDNYMPDITGEVFVELVTKLSPLQKIIVVSGMATVDVKLNVLKNDNVDFIDKETEPEIFLRRIERVLYSEKEDTVGVRKVYSAVEDIELDSFYRTVKVKGNEVSLTNKEYLLLNLFLTNKNHILSREKISEVVWKSGVEPSNRSVDVLIVKLRKKIKTNLIVSKRGVGYLWREK